MFVVLCAVIREKGIRRAYHVWDVFLFSFFFFLMCFWVVLSCSDFVLSAGIANRPLVFLGIFLIQTRMMKLGVQVAKGCHFHVVKTE